MTPLHFYHLPSEGWGKVIVSVCSHFGGVPDPALDGGVPDPALDGGGVPGLRFLGGVLGIKFLGECPRSQIFGGVSQVSDFRGGVPVSVKRKIFDTRFGLIHVQTGKKNFLSRDPPSSKGKFF